MNVLYESREFVLSSRLITDILAQYDATLPLGGTGSLPHFIIKISRSIGNLTFFPNKYFLFRIRNNQLSPNVDLLLSSLHFLKLDPIMPPDLPGFIKLLFGHVMMLYV